VLPLTEEWPQYAHPTRPEFLLTMPHRDHTSGFFIARLKKA
jgi:16S rRNA C967 or C1407 C5-methylase (RsmB/RsmF family)